MNFKQLSQQLLQDLPNLCSEWFPAGKRRGSEFKIGGLNGERGDSLSINLKTGIWKDFATGETGGDAISLYAAKHGISQGEAAKALGGNATHTLAVLPPPEEKEEWRPLNDLPDEDEMPRAKLFEGWTHHVYKRADGQLYGYIQRSKDKRICPVAWCYNTATGEENWQQKAFAKPRPLYGLETLKNHRTVVVVEGEKCADWLRQRCPVPVVTWAGGSNATQYTDWSPLKHRRVIIWPDNDAPGTKAANAIRETLPHAEILAPPAGKPEGWDCADWEDTDGNVVSFLPLDTPPPVTAVTVTKGDVSVTFEAGEVGRDAWAEYGIGTSQRGVPLTNLAGIECILGTHPHWEGRIWWDEFYERIFFKAEAGTEEWTDHHDRRALSWLQSVFELYNAGKSDVQDAVKLIAQTNRRNALTEWLRAIKWDGIPRVEELFTRGFGAEASPYVSAVGRCWLISAVARAFRPGCKVDTLPILEGSQGAGKSSGLRVLGGQWFSEIHADISEKDFLLQMKGKWILEIAEMHALTRAEVAKVKGILSNCCDRYRIPYEAHATDHPRRSVFAATTNRDDWQHDPTGARRFWPVRCGRINQGWLGENREQLFAEATYLLNDGRVWWDVPAHDAAAEVELRTPGDTWHEVLHARLNEDEHYSSVEIFDEFFGVPLRDQDYAKQRRLGEVMRSLKWEQKAVRHKGAVRRLWVFCGNCNAM